MSEPYLSLSALARRLGKSPDTIRRLAVSGVIPGHRPVAGGAWMFQESRVREAIEQPMDRAALRRQMAEQATKRAMQRRGAGA